jgi:menaquinone-9 beta-reductase
VPGSSVKSMIGHPQGASGAAGLVTALALAMATAAARRSTSTTRIRPARWTSWRAKAGRRSVRRSAPEAALSATAWGFGWTTSWQEQRALVARAIAVLRRLGLDAAVARGLRIDGMRISSERLVIDGRYRGGFGRTIMRRDLDEALLVAAARAGARIEEGALVDGPVIEQQGRVTGVRLATRGGRGTLDAKLVIAADGRYSRLARPLGLTGSAPHPRRWAVGAYFEGVAGLTSLGEMHVRRGHYVGVAPLPGGLANACVVTAERQALADPAALLARTVRTDARLAPRFSRARQVSAAVCLGPLGVEAAVAGAEGLLLAGDAAGFVDPMTGDGLRFAFEGGELAARAALRALEHGAADAHVRLLGARRRAFARKLRFNRALRALVGSAPAFAAAEAGAAVLPAILRHVVRYAGDERLVR